MSEGWSVDRIGDPGYRDKFVKLPEIIAAWVADHGGLAGKKIMDFGCGEATTALGIALQYDPGLVVGLDIKRKFKKECLALAREELGLEKLPQNLRFDKIEEGGEVPYHAEFDLVYSWSVFEHVHQDFVTETLRALKQAIKPGGLLLTQIAPLYYSSEGSHLYHWVSERWGHLVNQHNVYREKLAANCDESALVDLWGMYQTLNRMSAPRLIDAIKQSGLQIVREYRTQEEFAIPESLAAVYRAETLLTNQIVVLARKLDEADDMYHGRLELYSGRSGSRVKWPFQGVPADEMQGG